jgi:hypothetical protein
MLSTQFACEGISVLTLALFLNEADPSVGTLEGLLKSVDEHFERRKGLVPAHQCHKLFEMHALARFMRGRAVSGDIMCMGGRQLTKAGEWFWRHSGAVLLDARYLEKTLDETIAALRQPYPKALDDIERIKKERLDTAPWRGRLTREMLRPHFIDMPVGDARVLARLRAGRVALGCRLYRVRFGTYPKDLAELVAKLPEHFKELPTDPFTGKPLLYARTEAGCRICSVGDDRINNGGVETSPGYGRPDIVFELKR